MDRRPNWSAKDYLNKTLDDTWAYAVATHEQLAGTKFESEISIEQRYFNLLGPEMTLTLAIHELTDAIKAIKK